MKIPVSLEDEASRELPTAAELYKPIRQTVYSVLFNLNKLKIIYENQVKEKGKLWDTCTCGKEYLTFDCLYSTLGCKSIHEKWFCIFYKFQTSLFQNK